MKRCFKARKGVLKFFKDFFLEFINKTINLKASLKSIGQRKKCG